MPESSKKSRSPYVKKHGPTKPSIVPGDHGHYHQDFLHEIFEMAL